MQVLDRHVRNRNPVLLSGQRRMGKTSVARELGRRLEREGWAFSFADVERAASAEDVIAKIAEALHPVRGLASRLVERWARAFTENVEQLSAYEFGLKFRAGMTAGAWPRQGESIIRSCAEYDQPILLVIDELPIFLNRLLRRDDGLVSCPISFLHFRACCARQCKARSAGNIEHIGKGRNTAVARAASSRRARRTGPVAVLRPLARAGPFPAGRALPQTPCGTLKRKKLMGQDTSVGGRISELAARCNPRRQWRLLGPHGVRQRRLDASCPPLGFD